MKIRDLVGRFFRRRERDAEFDRRLGELQKKAPIPVFWLFGKTQSGKTSIIKSLTGAEQAEIGEGFKPTTRYSREYQFPAAAAPLMSFLDTRGIGEIDYDPKEDIDRFHEIAHVVIVIVRVMDFAQEHIRQALERVRSAKSTRPILLVLTCLHEAYPGQQHLSPYPFRAMELAKESLGAKPAGVSDDLWRGIQVQCEGFEGLVDYMVPIDLTRPEEGFEEPNYGAEILKQVLLELLPAAYRQPLLQVEALTGDLGDYLERKAVPHILGYSALAAAAGAFPIPWVDLFVLPGIQARMIYHLARIYGQTLSGDRFLELAGSLGMGLLVRQAVREVVKLIPGVGSVAAGALAGSSTFALGKACTYYYRAIRGGHVPEKDELRRYYQKQLEEASQWWKPRSSAEVVPPNSAAEAP